MTATTATPILGPPLVTHLQAVDTFMAKRALRRTGDNGYTRADLNTIFRIYAELCASSGVSFGVAVAQIAHETGWLTSWWSARPRRNPAGIGVTGATSPNQPRIAAAWDPTLGKWRAGLSFPDWSDSAVAHVGRLLGYALPVGAGTPGQRALLAEATAARPLPTRVLGCAPTLAGLGGTWAVPGTTYAQRLADKINTMTAA